MAAFEPFEARPVLAVAVSGGSDSLALCLLTDRWARARGGSVLAVTIDHGLRSGSAGEAAAVADWLGARGIAHAIRVWETPPSSGPLMARAREARYRLLEEICGTRCILHLLLGHTRDDQAETVLLRQAMGSGSDGLAGMPAVRETKQLRVLRPLLDVPKSRLEAVCRAAGQPWLDDPSNSDRRFARVRLRDTRFPLSHADPASVALVDDARRNGEARVEMERSVARLLGRAATVGPEGYILLDRMPLAAAPVEVAVRALSRCIRTVGGGAYPPRSRRLDNAYRAVVVKEKISRTLGGCRLATRGAAHHGLLICREPAAVAAPSPVVPGQALWWDRRFLVSVPARPDWAGEVEVRRLGTSAGRVAAWAGVPAWAAETLPSLWRGAALVAVPVFSCRQDPPNWRTLSRVPVTFAPAESISGAFFGVV